MSPGFADLLSLWDAHHLNNAQRVGVPLLALLADMLRVKPAAAAQAQGFVHLQLDGVARALCQRRMRAVYSHLTSGVRTRHNAGLTLLAAIAGRNAALAWEVFRAFDFSLKELPVLATPRGAAGDKNKKSKSSSSKRLLTSNATSNGTSNVDDISLPSRHVFVAFALALLESGDKTLTRPVLAQKALFGNVLRHVASDPPALAARALRALRDVVLAESGGVPPRLRAALCGDAALEQMAAISGTDAGDREEEDDDDGRGDAARTAHDVLSRLCVDPAHGVCPASTLGRWTPPEERLSEHGRDDTDGDEDANGARFSFARERRLGSEAEGGDAGASARVASGAKRCATLVRLLRKLRPTESRRHAELLLRVCELRPRVAALYLPHATYSLDPRPSVAWLAAAALLGEVAANASLDPTPPRAPADAPGEAEGTAFVKAAMPASATRAGLAKGLAHASGLVRHTTLCLLLRVLCAIRRRVARLDETAANAADAGNAADAERFAALARRARGAALAALPEPQALLAEISKQRRSPNEETDPTRNSVASESDMNRIHALNALAEYCELVGPEGLAEANVDPAKTTPPEPLDLPPAELAATVGFLAAARGVPSRARRRLLSDEADAADERNATHAAASVSRASLAAAAGDAAAAATAAARRAAAAGESARFGAAAVPRGHMLAILRVAAGAPVASIRRDASAVAAAYVASCGAFETAASARKEAGAWIANLPTVRARGDTKNDAACAFLAEAAAATARRPGADADAAASALRARYGGRGAPRWPRIARWTASRAGDAMDADVASEDDAGGGPRADPPVLAAGAAGEDLEFSGLTAHALAACVKVLGSAKRADAQKEAVAEYVAASVLDVLTQQTDAVPLAALVLESLRDAPRDAARAGADAEEAPAKAGGKKKKIGGAAARAGGDPGGGGGGGGDAGVHAGSKFDLGAYPALVSLVRLASVIVEGSKGLEGDSAEFSSRAEGVDGDASASPAAAIGAAMLAASGASKRKSSKTEPAIAALDDVDLADGCRAAAARLPFEAVPAEARRIAFWCAYAAADFDRRGGEAPASASARRGFVEMLGTCGATLARAREMAEHSPAASLSARRALLECPALASGFLNRGAAFAGALAEIALDDLEAAGADPPGAPYAAAAAEAATAVLLAGPDLDRANEAEQVATALAAAPLARRAAAAARRRLADAAAASADSGPDPARRALAAEAAAAVLSRVSRSTGVLPDDDDGASADASAALSAAFAAALRLAATGDDAGGARASDAAAAALAAAKSFSAEASAAGASSETRRTTPPDFASVAAASAALGRAVAASVAGTDSPSTARLEEALAAASPAHADRLLALVAEALAAGALSARALFRLMPAARAALERRVAAAVAVASGDALASLDRSEKDDDEGASIENESSSSAKRSKRSMSAFVEVKGCDAFPGVPDVSASRDAASRAATATARAFGAAACAFFVRGAHPAFASGAESREDEDDTLRILETHAPATLAAAHALAPLDDAAADQLAAALAPPEGWWGADEGAAGPARGASARARAAAARLLFGGDNTRPPRDLSGASAWSRATAAYATSLLSTLRVLALVVPPAAAARAERRGPDASTNAVGASRAAVAAAAEAVIASDLHALLDTRGDVLGRVATPELVAAARGFTRTALRRRFGNTPSLAALALVRRTAAALASAASGDAPGTETDARMAGHLAAFARDAFERLASHSATARTLLHPGANAPLPPSVAAMAAPLASLLPATHDDEKDDGGAGGDAYVAASDSAEDDGPDEGVETDDSARDDHAARTAKLELVCALHALWSLHGDASSLEASGDDFDADLASPFTAELDDGSSSDPEDVPPAHHAVWRAEQSALIPLLAAAHGATLSACDRRLAALMLEMDAAAGGGALRAMGYLWGDAAAYLARTDAALKRSTEGFLFLSGDERKSADERSSSRDAFTHADASPAAIAAASRAGAPPDARRCAATATRFPHARASPAPAPRPSLGADAADEPLSELRRQGLLDPDCFVRNPHAEAPAYAYDPAWVLPFALAGLRSGSLEARDAAQWGVAGVAFAAAASADETTRAVAFATLDALQKACDETARPEAANFRERAQLAALLQATRNGLAPEGAKADGEGAPGGATFLKTGKRARDDEDELPTLAKEGSREGLEKGATKTSPYISDIARLPTATAVFAAEAATAALHPAGDTYVITQRAVHRRAALDGDALPVNFLGALNGSGGGGAGDRAENVAVVTASRGEARALRVWVLRLLLASLRAGPEDARLFRKAFAAEVLMSHRTATLSSDPYARQAALAVVARAAATPAAARALVEGSGLVAWLAGAVRAACRPTKARAGEAAGARAAAAATATAALATLAQTKGAFYGGPAGTAADFLSAARDVRAALAPLFRTSLSSGFGSHDAATLAACRATLLPALRLHAAVARRLTRRLGEVLDPAETVALCRATAAHDAFLASSDASDANAADARKRRGGSSRARVNENEYGNVERKRKRERLREAMLRVVVSSSGSGRDADGFGAESSAFAETGRNAHSGAMHSPLARAAAAALAEVSRWAADAAAQSSDPQEWASRVLSWATTSLREGGAPLVAAVAARQGGGGAAAYAATLGALRDASSLPAAAAAAPALARAGAALLRAVAACPTHAEVAAGDAPAWAATRRAAYRELLKAGGALDELLEVCVLGERRDAGAEARARGLLAAELAGTMLRGAFAGVPPVAFARHVADTATGSSSGSFRFRFVAEWKSPGREWPADDDDAGGKNAWRLADALADAGVCAAPAPKPPAPPSPAARVPSKRRRVEV